MDVLKWISQRRTEAGAMRKLREEFGRMLRASEQVFRDGAAVFLGETPLSEVREQVFATDKQVNKGERSIRREIVVHAAVHHGLDFIQSLILMSIVKDAERLGDYGKNLFDLAEMSPEPCSGTHREHVTVLRDRLLLLFQECLKVLESNDEEQAKQILCSATALEDRCDEAIKRFVKLEDDAGNMVATYVLAYRYFKRVASHLRNITSSVVQPVHKLDFTSKITGRPESKE
jgi:phosphate transport system protein